ncbi:MAG: tRNA (adenosine(37)-N6)-dimethylallyltransferase MiaA [Phycisphaeraceae bacterium]|nr:tRNA (adenosine(37)-N6)-dimethylallyltransferase MiaA [Phycisphaeraceae bacterium]
MVRFATGFLEGEYTRVSTPRRSSDAQEPFNGPTLLLAGPTAGGKTALALAIARRVRNIEIVSADSMQVYRGMDIGTAKPTPEERSVAPHHLIDCANPHEGEFTMAQWLRGAREAIDSAHARGAAVIVVGGTNLYVRALLEGVVQAPEVDPTLRQELESLPTAEARARLEAIDPEAAARIHSNDRRRTLRALELHRLTGKAPSVLRTQWSDTPRPLPEGLSLVGLEWPVDAINRRINERVRTMLKRGLVEEVRALLAKGPLTRQAIEAVGYREMAEHLAGRVTLEEATEETKIRSRRLGKQQRTWLRRFRLIPNTLWLDGEMGPEALVERVLGYWPLKGFTLTER